MRNSKIIFIFLGICVVYLFLTYAIYTAWSSPAGKRSVNLSYVVVHIDLKGAPPKLEYLESLLPMLKDNGVNGLLMEYEDMFPYEGRLVNLSAKYCYSRKKLRRFLTAASLQDIEIIPLIQTFGHLEHALKLQEFTHLREHPDYPDSVCPSKTESRSLVAEMLEQVVTFHNNITHLKHIHVGCDEVYQINKCQHCINRGLSNANLYVEYIRHVSNVITKLSPDTRVLIWDDMVRQLRPPAWSKIDCFNNIDPVYWNYEKTITINQASINNYHKKFKHIWAATAFKGADGNTAVIPNLGHRLSNHLEWMKVLQNFKISGESTYYDFKGIILTGWSRYSHMHPLCEMLPVAIPSLILNLHVVNTYKSDAVDKSIQLNNFFYKYLTNKDQHFSCDVNLKNIYLDADCEFEGVTLYRDLTYFMQVVNQTYSFLRNDLSLHSTSEFYSKTNYVFVYSIEENIKACTNVLNKLTDVERKIALSMKPYFESYVVAEFLGYNLFGLKKEIAHRLQVLHSFPKSNRVWKRRDEVSVY